MIFRTLHEDKCNLGVHGRCFKCSERFLKFYKDYECRCDKSKPPHKGFWYDATNDGIVDDEGDTNKNEKINSGTYHMAVAMKQLSRTTDFSFDSTIMFNYFYGFRGRLGLDGLTAEINAQRYAIPKT
jgi:hypothetical protein